MRGPGESYSDVILRLVADAGRETGRSKRDWRMGPLVWLVKPLAC